MKRILSTVTYLTGISLILLLSSCTNFGTKVKIAGTKGEVFYKDGATESDANKIGTFLKQDGFLSDSKAASVQVSKKADTYLVRFVYDKQYYNSKPELEDVFRVYGAKLSKELFNGKKVDVALADKYFKDFKTIPFDEATAKSLEENPDETLTKTAFEHETAGGVTFYWKGITDEESKNISDYIVKNGSFAGGTAEIYITKEGERYFLRFPIKPEYRDDAATIAEVEKVSRQIKENVFANNQYTFEITDEKLDPIKSFEY
jgi:hypothetical protein